MGGPFINYQDGIFEIIIEEILDFGAIGSGGILIAQKRHVNSVN